MDPFTRAVNTGKTLGSMFLRRKVVGIGSSSQLLLGDLCMILATSWSERTEKLSIIGGSGVTMISALFTDAGRSLVMLFIPYHGDFRHKQVIEAACLLPICEAWG